MRLLRWLIALALIGGGVFWVLTRPAPVPPEYASLTGDAERGALVFAVAGCASCHIAPGAEPSDAPVLAGGERFVSDFGTFLAPNISPSSQGIGDWTDAEIMHAVAAGVSPGGAHYYPAFPYTSYHFAEPQDLADLVAHLRTLPPSDVESLPHEIGFPVTIRRGIGLWKMLYLSEDWTVAGAADAQIERGRYLVEGLGHCAECHTPRDALGGLDRSAWMAGAPNPSGEGRVPAITPGELGWSAADIAYYLETGFTPDFDVAGGDMADVVLNTGKLPPEDREAIAAYLVALP